jgi:hypothetical protein
MQWHHGHGRRRVVAPERLEARSLLASDTSLEPVAMPGIDTGSEVWHTLNVGTGPEFSAGFPQAAATTPWISAAAEGTAGAVVFWIKLTVVDGVPSLHIAPIWARLNPTSDNPPVAGMPSAGGLSGPPGEAGLPPDEASLMASLDGLLFRGSDGADDPPLTSVELADFSPELVEGVQEYFLVVRSPFNVTLLAATAGLLLAGMPAGESNAASDGSTTVAGTPAASSDPAVSAPPPAEAPLPPPLSWLLRLRADRPFAPAGDPAGAFPAGEGTPRWLLDAQQGDKGALVLWVTETTAGGSASINMLPVWVRWNPVGTVDPGLDLFADASAGTSSTVVYPGVGVPDADSGVWPKPIESFEPQQMAQMDDSRSYFMVMRSESNAEIALVTAFTVLFQLFQPPVSLTSDTAIQDGGTPPLPLAGLDGGGDTTGALSALFRSFGQNPVAAPAVRLVSDTGASADDRITSSGRLDVDTAPGFQARYSTDGGLTWRNSFRPREGVNTVLVRQVDRSGLTSPATSFAFTLDRRRPAAPRVMVAPAGTDGAFISTAQGALVNTRLEPGTRLEYSTNGGFWTADLVLTVGRNSIRVRQVDAAGNASRPSMPVRIWQLLAAGEGLATATPVTSLRPRLRR